MIDFWLISIFTLCCLALAMMLIGFLRFRKSWNQKTRDYWYGRIMWVLSGMSLTAERVFHQHNLRVTLIFVTIAILVTLKGNFQRGSWGYHDD